MTEQMRTPIEVYNSYITLIQDKSVEIHDKLNAYSKMKGWIRTQLAKEQIGVELFAMLNYKCAQLMIEQIPKDKNFRVKDYAENWTPQIVGLAGAKKDTILGLSKDKDNMLSTQGVMDLILQIEKLANGCEDGMTALYVYQMLIKDLNFRFPPECEETMMKYLNNPNLEGKDKEDAAKKKQSTRLVFDNKDDFQNALEQFVHNMQNNTNLLKGVPSKSIPAYWSTYDFNTVKNLNWKFFNTGQLDHVSDLMIQEFKRRKVCNISPTKE